MKCIILAGGFATRLWPLTEKTAKPLILLAGKPLISYIVESLPPELGIIISTNAVFAADFQDWKQHYFPTRDIEIFVEDSKSETVKKGALFATALVISEKNITEDVLLIAGDNYFGFSLEKFICQFEKYPDSALLAAYDIQEKEKATAFGVIVPKEESADEVMSFQEKPEEPASTLVSTGCFLFPAELLLMLQEFAAKSRDDLGKVFEHFLSQEKSVRYFSFAENWFDVGSFPAYLEANMTLLKNKTQKAESARVAPDANISGGVFLGENVVIGPQVSLENSIILEGTTLENCTIRDCVIGKNVFVSNVDLSNKIIRDESFLLRES